MMLFGNEYATSSRYLSENICLIPVHVNIVEWACCPKVEMSYYAKIEMSNFFTLNAPLAVIKLICLGISGH